MSKSVVLLLALLVLPSANLVEGATQSTRRKAKVLSRLPPQALPIDSLLKALETSNVVLYQSAYSSKYRAKYPADFDKLNWKKIREKEFSFYHDAVGVKSRKGLEYKFVGDDSRGFVSIRQKGKELTNIYVVKEDDQWKIMPLDISPPH
jgi:hypothetical protein